MEEPSDHTVIASNAPEIIFIKYEGDSFDKTLGEHQVIIQIKTDEDGTQIEYQDSPELLDLAEIKDSSAVEETSNNNKVVDATQYPEDAGYDKEISNAVSSIEHEQEIACGSDGEEYNKGEYPPNTFLMYACEPTSDEDISKYLCKTCGLVVGCIFCLKTHYQSVHTNTGIMQYLCKQTVNLQVNQADVCPKCKLICSGKDDLLEHRKIHFASCVICAASFDSPLFLSNHCRERHDDYTVTLECEICDGAFAQLSDLSDHYRSYHTMVLCIVCLERFGGRPALEAHTKKHAIVLTEERPLPFACSRCDAAFAAIGELSKHLNVEHSRRRKAGAANGEQAAKKAAKREAP